MLKELLEGHFYGTFPKVTNRVLNITEHVQNGSFSLLDKEACRNCHFICNSDPEKREQMKVKSTFPVHYICLDDVFCFVKEDIGETCDYLLECNDTVAVVEMTCSTTEYVTGKRQKARHQLLNTISLLMTSPTVKIHIERLKNHVAVFSWRETFDKEITDDPVGKNMEDMMAMSDEVYSPENESKFDFDFKLKEIRYPYPFVV